MVRFRLDARLWLVSGPLLALVLGACGDDSAARSERAVEWLRAYTKDNPPNQIWEANEIRVGKKGRVEMEVLIPSEKQVEALKSLPKMEKARIVQRACPLDAAEVWTILGGDVELWINLNGKDGYIIGATCRH